MIAKFWKSGLGIISLIFIVNVVIQSWTVGKFVNVVTDEGVYLYASQLIERGLIPYKDFFLGHLPLWPYINSLILKIFNNNMDIFHYIYIVWASSAIFPLFLIIKSITKTQFGAIVACIIFLTFPEMVQWDSHFFTLRQASLPFLAWAIYLLISKRNPILLGFLLALFGASLFSNYFVIFILIGAYLWKYPMTPLVKDPEFYLKIFTSFALISMAYWLLIFATPNSISNIFGFQMNRYYFSFHDRLNMLKGMIGLNWVYFVLGIGSIILTIQKHLWLGIFNIISILTLVFVGATFLPHYLVVASIGIAISMGIGIEMLLNTEWEKATFLMTYVFILYLSTFTHMRYNLIDVRSPDFFYAIDILKDLPSPIFTLEPIYGVFAQRDITYFYLVADPRFYDVTYTSIPSDLQTSLIQQSNTILLDYHTRLLLNYDSIIYIEDNYQLVAVTKDVEIWTKKK